MMSETINSLVDIAVQELAALQRDVLEKSIEFAIRENCDGALPSVEECRRRGRIVRVVYGDDNYTEFQWDGVGQFRQRVTKRKDGGYGYEVRIDYAPR